MKDGIILLDKESGLSSAGAIARVKRKLGISKIGHAGTLDPLATGLLVCLINGATRLADYAQKGEKLYSGCMLLGVSTATDDIEGEVLGSSTAIPGEDEMRHSAQSFVGQITQTPPAISAIKVGGMASYDHVRRKGKAPDLQPRKVEVREFTIERIEGPRLFFRIRCSSGTYIRAIARDLGAQLGCGGCIASLRREESSPFSSARARKVEDLNESDILDWHDLLPGVPAVDADHEELQLLRNGDQRVLKAIAMREHSRLEGAKLAILRSDGLSRALLERHEPGWASVVVMQ